MNLNLAFCNSNCLGHFVPMIAIAKKFRERGHNIIFLLLDTSEEVLHRLNIENFKVIYILEKKYNERGNGKPLKYYMEISQSIAKICEERNIDTIFTGELFPPGSIAGDLAKILVVKIFPNPYIYTENGDSPLIDKKNENYFSCEQFLYYQYINFIRCQLKLKILPTNELILSKFVNILLVEKDIPGLKLEKNDNVQIMGPIIDFPNKFYYTHNVFREITRSEIKIFVSLGTEISRRKDSIAFFNKIIKTFSVYSDEQVQMILYLGPYHPMKKNQYSYNNKKILVLDGFIPQVEIISSIDLVISHGGWNTVHETLYSCKPIIIFPYEGHHFQTADWIEKKKFGLKMDFFNFKENELRNNIVQLIIDQEIKKKLKEFSTQLKSEKRIENTLDYIESRFFLEKKSDYKIRNK